MGETLYLQRDVFRIKCVLFFGLKKIEDLQNDDIFDRKVIRIENYLLMLKKFE